VPGIRASLIESSSCALCLEPCDYCPGPLPGASFLLPLQCVNVGFRALGQELSNGERWGQADQIGTLNLVTAAHIQAAARAIVTGKVLTDHINRKQMRRR
jgi:hypothetical protein